MKKYNIREDLISSLPSGLIGAELGVFEGTFSNVLWKSGKFRKLYLVDIFNGIMFSGDKNGENGKTINLDEAYNKISDEYRNIPEVEVVKSSTVEFLKSISDEFLDFIYIDADHSYGAVKNDLSLAKSKVKLGGIIAGHDYNHSRFPGVVNAVDEFIQAHNLSLTLTMDDKLSSYYLINE